MTPELPSPQTAAARRAAAEQAQRQESYERFLQFLARNLENHLGKDHPSFRRY